MGDTLKKINKANPFGKLSGSALPSFGIKNPFEDKKEDLGSSAADTLAAEQERLKKLKASTFTSGGLIGEELQANSGNTTFGN